MFDTSILKKKEMVVGMIFNINDVKSEFYGVENTSFLNLHSLSSTNLRF